MASLAAVLVLCMAGLAAVLTHVRCLDAAREVARLAARGDDTSAGTRGLVPDGARVDVQSDGGHVVARVTTSAPLLPGLVISAEAVAAAEQGS